MVFVPSEIEADGTGLLWNYSKPTHRHPGTGMLSRFVDLHDATDQEILAYARDWGVLGFCSHDLPASHNQFPFSVASGLHPCSPLPGSGFMAHHDPYNLWRKFSGQFKGLWQVAIKLGQKEKIIDTDWEAIPGLAQRAEMFCVREMHPDARITPQRTAEERRKRGVHQAIAEKVNDWMAFGKVRPDFTWNRERKDWEIAISAKAVPNLFGLLVVSLMLAISDKDGFAICSICNRWYMPDRRPAANRKSYCTKPSCHKAKWRLYKREKE
jgi:hypothetical protein